MSISMKQLTDIVSAKGKMVTAKDGTPEGQLTLTTGDGDFQITLSEFDSLYKGMVRCWPTIKPLKDEITAALREKADTDRTKAKAEIIAKKLAVKLAAKAAREKVLADKLATKAAAKAKADKEKADKAEVAAKAKAKAEKEAEKAKVEKAKAAKAKAAKATPKGEEEEEEPGAND